MAEPRDTDALTSAAIPGVDQFDRFAEIMTSTLFAAPVFKIYSEIINARRFEPAQRVLLALQVLAQSAVGAGMMLQLVVRRLTTAPEFGR